MSFLTLKDKKRKNWSEFLELFAFFVFLFYFISEMEKYTEYSDVENSPRSFSRRDFIKGFGLVTAGLMIPRQVQNVLDDGLTEEQRDEALKEWEEWRAKEAKEAREQYIQDVLQRQYEYRDDDEVFDMPVRDAFDLDGDDLVYTLPYDYEDISNIPQYDTHKGARDSRKYYPLTAFHFYRGKGARFDRRFLKGCPSTARPQRETTVPLIDQAHEDLFVKNLSDMLLQLGIDHQELENRPNIIISLFEKNGHGALGCYLDGQLLCTSNIAGSRNRGTTFGVYPEIFADSPWRKSANYYNFPMPYAVHYGTGGEFVHAGNVRGYSHGCTRVEGIKSGLLWRLVMDKRDEGGDAFAMVAMREGSDGSDLLVRDTNFHAVGYNPKKGHYPAFVDRVFPVGR